MYENVRLMKLNRFINCNWIFRKYDLFIYTFLSVKIITTSSYCQTPENEHSMSTVQVRLCVCIFRTFSNWIKVWLIFIHCSWWPLLHLSEILTYISVCVCVILCLYLVVKSWQQKKIWWIALEIQECIRRMSWFHYLTKWLINFNCLEFIYITYLDKRWRWWFFSIVTWNN